MRSPRNLSELICDRAERRPDARFGMAGSELTLGQAVELAMAGAGHMTAAGLQPGDRAALIGPTSNAWLVAWLGMVLAGAEAALVNPDYPPKLMGEMLAQLHPEAVLWVGRQPDRSVSPEAAHFDASAFDQGRLLIAQDPSRPDGSSQIATRSPSEPTPEPDRKPRGLHPDSPTAEEKRTLEPDREPRDLHPGSPSAKRKRTPEPDRKPRDFHPDKPGIERRRTPEPEGEPRDGLLKQAVIGPRADKPPGLARGRLDTAGYMHTSGTTGVPKFCEQSHEYFLRLGRFIADSMCLSENDTVMAPLPMFHINPLGYGVVGGLTGGADVLGIPKFSARSFWETVRACEASVLILHAPPVEILKKATTAEDAAGHKVSRMFFADPDFLETFNIPLGFSAYGSTEAAGLCHIWAWRRGDRPELAEGMSRYGGRARHDVCWKVDDDGEINIRADRNGVLFNGYRQGSELVCPLDDDGWFHTGDLGRVDSLGNLVFIERRSESIRVKGEFVPIGYVEQRFAAVEGVADAAVWRRRSDLVDDELVLYVTGDTIPKDAIKATSAALPRFMRPAMVTRVTAIPRDTGVGKVRRRLLDKALVLETCEP